MVVAVGFAVTFAPVVADKPVLGDHVNAPAPEAVNAVLLPLQMLLFPAIEITGVGLTVMETNVESNKLQPPPITYKIALYVPGVP